VALAGEEHNVAGRGGLKCKANGRGAVRLYGVLDAAGFQSGFDFREDGERIFRARIVAGGDDEIAAFAGGHAHLGALGAVAIAAAAKERDDALAALRGHLPGERREIAQRVVGVGVVHDHGEGLARIDGLKAAGNRFERGHAGNEIGKLDATRMGGGQRGKKIEDVDFAGQLGFNAG